MRGLGLGLGLSQRTLSAIVAPPNNGLPPEATVDFTTDQFHNGTPTNASLLADTNTDDYYNLVADSLKETAVTGSHQVNKATGVVLSIGQLYTADFVLKPDGRSFALLQVSGGGNNAYICVDLTTNNPGLMVGIEPGPEFDLIDNGYVFVRFTFVATNAAAVGMTIYTATSNTVFSGIVGDITKGLIIARFTLSHA